MTPASALPPKPPLVFKGLPGLPAIYALQDTAQWVNWRYVWKPNPNRPDGGKWDKPPVDPRTNALASSTAPKTWGSFDEAAKAARIYPETGVGFVLTPTDGFTGIDLDDCRNPATGELDGWAADILDFSETYAEVSPSGCGVRLFALGKVEKATTFKPAGVEVYGSGRYLTVTGHHVSGAPEEIKPAPKTIAALLARVATMKPSATEPYTPAVNGIGSRAQAVALPRGKSFFRNVNDAALDALSSWFPSIFPTARHQVGTSGYRVLARDLGRDLEEDLSATPLGIVDFGIHDMGDAREGKRTAIDVVEEWGGAADALAAARWLCDRMGRTPSSLGWEERETMPASNASVPDSAGVVRAAAASEPPPPMIKATPFVWQEPTTFPRRQWLLGFDYCRKYLSGLISPGASGKSSLMLIEALVLVTGRPLLGIAPRETVKVWYFNGEDPREETMRRLLAAMKFYGISREEVEGRLFVDSGRDTPISLAETGKHGTKIAVPTVDAITQQMVDLEIGAMLVDPFVSTHGVGENDNVAINLVARQWGSIAERTNAAVALAHHARKPGGEVVTTETSRGASSLMDAVRMGRAINKMTKAQADEIGVEEPNRYFRIGGADSPGKHNMAPPIDKTRWFQLASVDLGNAPKTGNPFEDASSPQGDHVAVVTTWEPAKLMDHVESVAQLDEIQRRVAAGKWRESYQAVDWVGNVVAAVLDLDVTNKGHRTRIRKLLAVWMASKALEIYEAKDDHGEIKKFVGRGPGTD